MNVKYKIITEKTYNSLEIIISKYLQEGWKLAGGVSTWANGFMQAIYLENDPNEGKIYE